MKGHPKILIIVLCLTLAGPIFEVLHAQTVDSLIAALESFSDYEDMFGYRLSFGQDDHKGVGQSVLSVVEDGRWVTRAEAVTY